MPVGGSAVRSASLTSDDDAHLMKSLASSVFSVLPATTHVKPATSEARESVDASPTGRVTTPHLSATSEPVLGSCEPTPRSVQFSMNPTLPLNQAALPSPNAVSAGVGSA